MKPGSSPQFVVESATKESETPQGHRVFFRFLSGGPRQSVRRGARDERKSRLARLLPARGPVPGGSGQGQAGEEAELDHLGLGRAVHLFHRLSSFRAGVWAFFSSAATSAHS
jgi:hypothetical protein